MIKPLKDISGSQAKVQKSSQYKSVHEGTSSIHEDQNLTTISTTKDTKVEIKNTIQCRRSVKRIQVYGAMRFRANTTDQQKIWIKETTARISRTMQETKYLLTCSFVLSQNGHSQ